MELISVEKADDGMVLQFRDEKKTIDIRLSNEEAIHVVKQIWNSVSSEMASQQRQVFVESMFRSNTRRMIDESY